ncbi:GNAT family N-acetyltransferase [Bradyrhizobium prioriisuperbiae]|uniref:GNAT family N-acetyltransferase n=1 Tax=Bradyrhizobium prioriisuperbiae TaxID=2854389 RepID=UPI0028ED6E81|nr:GNAT family N-acetyltransferase [Bradyrhizobium prioritasuperba]
MLRHALASDVPQIAALYHSIWHETHARFMPAEECERRDVAFFHDRMTVLQPTTLVTARDRAIIGFAAWHDDVLSQMFVASQWRGSGLALCLLARAEQGMARAGIEHAKLHCVAGNDRARRFYERQDWTVQEQFAHAVAGQPDGVSFWRMVKRLGLPRSTDIRRNHWLR